MVKHTQTIRRQIRLLFFTFFNVFLNKSNCFKTLELHVVQLIVILFLFDYIHRFDIVLFQFIVLYNWTYFFCLYYHHLLDPN